jgi:uncharacterized membrane protein
MGIFAIQAATEGQTATQRLLETLQAPIPQVSLWVAIVLLIILWVLARARRRVDTDVSQMGERVLRERYARGEITEETYKKLLADVRMKPKY